jgi:hypothetical protein
MPTSDDNFGEDLLLQARQARALVSRHCRDSGTGCGDFHSAYPLLRIAGLVGGVEADRNQLVPMLRDLSVNGARRWLAPGAADSGILATIAHSCGLLKRSEHVASRSQHHFNVLDVCRTPLELNEEFARRHDLGLTTHCIDLATARFPDDSFDVIVAHMVLTFLAPAHQLAVLRAMAQWLSPDTGRLVIVMRFGESPATQEMKDKVVTHRLQRIRELSANGSLDSGIFDGAAVAGIERMLRSSFDQFETGMASLDDVRTLLTSVGFTDIQVQQRSPERDPAAWSGGPPRPRAIVMARATGSAT